MAHLLHAARPLDPDVDPEEDDYDEDEEDGEDAEEDEEEDEEAGDRWWVEECRVQSAGCRVRGAECGGKHQMQGCA